MDRFPFARLFHVSWVVIASVVWGQEAPPETAPPAAELPKNLKALAVEAGLTAEETDRLARAIRVSEEGRAAAEKKVADADKAWRDATSATPSDPEAVGRAEAACSVAKEERKRVYREQELDYSKLMPADKHQRWVEVDLNRTVARELARVDVTLDAAQLKALVDLIKAESPTSIADGTAGTKATRNRILAVVREKILTAEQRAAIEAAEAAKKAGAGEPAATSTTPTTPP